MYKLFASTSNVIADTSFGEKPINAASSSANSVRILDYPVWQASPAGKQLKGQGRPEARDHGERARIESFMQ
jgi:hypothetical protein